MFLVILAFIILGTSLVYYFLRHDHGRKLPIETLWVAFILGILGILAAGFLELHLLPKNLFVIAPSGSLLPGFFTFMAVGVIEEAVKFIPLALIIYKKPYFSQYTDGVIYFAICGLTFGLFENILYTISFGAKAGLIRLVVTPFLHAATTGILGYYLVSAKINRANRGKFIVACVAIPFIHGFYDFGLFSRVLQLLVLALMITLMLTLSMFLYFSHANDLDKAMLAVAPIPPQNFCPNCGRPNARRTMFCEFCGRRL